MQNIRFSAHFSHLAYRHQDNGQDTEIPANKRCEANKIQHFIKKQITNDSMLKALMDREVTPHTNLALFEDIPVHQGEPSSFRLDIKYALGIRQFRTSSIPLVGNTLKEIKSTWSSTRDKLLGILVEQTPLHMAQWALRKYFAAQTPDSAHLKNLFERAQTDLETSISMIPRHPSNPIMCDE